MKIDSEMLWIRIDFYDFGRLVDSPNSERKCPHPPSPPPHAGPSWCSVAIWGPSMLFFHALGEHIKSTEKQFSRKMTLPLRVHSAMRFPNACAQFLIEQRSFLIHPFFVFYQTPDRPPLGQLLVYIYIYIFGIWYLVFVFGIWFCIKWSVDCDVDGRKKETEK